MDCPHCGRKMPKLRIGHQGGASKSGHYYRQRKKEKLGTLDILGPERRGRPKKKTDLENLLNTAQTNGWNE